MSIKSKLLILFLAIALVPLVFISALTFANYKQSLEAVRLSALQNEAAFKAGAVERHFERLRVDVEMSQSFFNIKKNLPVLTRFAGEPAGPVFAAAKRELDGQLSKMQPLLGLTDIMLTDAKGRIVYSSNPGHRAEDFLKSLPGPRNRAFEEGRKGIFFSDVFLNERNDQKPGMLITAPATDAQGGFIGVIAFEADMAPVYKILEDADNPSRTGETLLGKKEGGEVVFLNPLRFDPGAALKRRVTIGAATGAAIQAAAQGGNGSGRTIDYRGKPVVVAWRYIPSLSWGIVAKIDAEEAFAEITKLRKLAAVILGIISLLAGVMAVSVSRSISGPIQNLSRGVEIVGSGNLDHKVGTQHRDEIGRLSRAFDAMTAAQKRAREELRRHRDSLEELVKERTSDLESANQELARSNENLEQFAYVASHDLQEPLRVMSSYSQLLEKRYHEKLDQDAKDFIDFIVDAASRMQRLITDLLAYSRVGRKGVVATEVDLNEVMKKVLFSLSSAVESSGGRVTHDELPVLTVHETSALQVFQNLIANALKFRGEKPSEIRVGARKDGGEWVFSVADNGLGIEPQYHERIFQIFQRLHSREEYSGTGIGLSICKKIVSSWGGRIWVESELGKGSTFYFTMPV